MTAQEGREGEGGSLREKGEEQTMLGEKLLIIYHLLYISMSNPEERMLYKHWVWVGWGWGWGGLRWWWKPNLGRQLRRKAEAESQDIVGAITSREEEDTFYFILFLIY